MITGDKVDLINRKIRKAIAEIEKEENVKISFGVSRYNSLSYRSTMTVTTVEKTEKVNVATENQMLNLSKGYGFTQNIIGMEFQATHKGRETVFKITDIKPRNRKYPIIGTNGQKSFKFSSDTVLRNIGGNKVVNRNANLKKLFGE